MNATLQPYPAYKDSGAPWLGQVPERWEMRRARTLLRERVQIALLRECRTRLTADRADVSKSGGFAIRFCRNVPERSPVTGIDLRK
jgi:hypothetical protein